MNPETIPEPLARLLRLGEPEIPWPDYPTLLGLTEEHIPALIQMATTEPDWDEMGDTPGGWQHVHAWRALAQMGAVGAIPALVQDFRWVDEQNDDWAAEELPEALGILGPAAIPVLSDYLADETHGMWARSSASDGLEWIARLHPEVIADCAQAMARTLARYATNDMGLNGSLVYSLSRLRQVETYDLVAEAYRADRVDEFVLGDWEDFQVLVGLLESRTTKRDADWEPDPLFEPVPSPLHRQHASNSAKKEKNKRKQEKKSRQKNRKR